MKKYEPLKKYALIYTYNFDNSSTIMLYNTLEKACNNLKKAAKKEYKIEKEENGFDCELFHSDNWDYACVIHHEGFESTCEYRVTGDLYECI